VKIAVLLQELIAQIDFQRHSAIGEHCDPGAKEHAEGLRREDLLRIAKREPAEGASVMLSDRTRAPASVVAR
jgi:hypothetical protein